jgi:hypothetical protein
MEINIKTQQRKLYERSKPPRKGKGQKDPKSVQPVTIIISRKGKTIERSKINILTGTTILTAEVTDNEIIIRFPPVRQEVKK